MSEPIKQTLTSPAPLLDIRDLKIWYRTYRGFAQVVDGINMRIYPGEKIGLVGESGCGKTTTMKTILRLLDESRIHIPQGEILVNGRDVLKMNNKEILQVRRKQVCMISQEPMAALNPMFNVGQQLADIIKASGQCEGASREEIAQMSLSAIKDVMISDPERMLTSYPHQLSGGMRQRVCIAMALVTPRELMIADEPCTALDVTIQAQIHKLLRNLVEESNRSLIMITHSLGVARELVDTINVMYAGNIVETAPTAKLLQSPAHPYTVGLIKCVPRLFGSGVSEGIYGYVPDYVNPGPGCRFHNRCPDARGICRRCKPGSYQIEERHLVSCFKFAGGAEQDEYSQEGGSHE